MTPDDTDPTGTQDTWESPYADPWDDGDEFMVDDWGGGFGFGGLDEELEAAPYCQRSSIHTLRVRGDSLADCSRLLDMNAWSQCRYYDYSNYPHTDGHTYSCTTTSATVGTMEALVYDDFESGEWKRRYECHADISCTREGRRDR